LENENLKYPILIHCLSGKDRTGIVVAALLLILGLNENEIKEEYLLSEGEVKLELIQKSLDGMKNLEKYFDRIDIKKIRANIKPV
jgi:protein-tyrosine phosphatase